MNKLSLRKQLRAMSSALSSLLLASGCHYYGGSNSTPGYSEYDSITSPPFYRSFQRPQPYDSEPENSTTPSVLPTPGYSEPNEVPPPPAPAPSAKKSKWNFFQSGVRFPGFSRQNNQINQTSAGNSHQDNSTQTADLDGSTKLPELSSTPTIIRQSAPATNDSSYDDNSVKSVLKQDDVDFNQVTVKPSRKNRSTSIQQWPAPKSAAGNQAFENDLSSSNSASSNNTSSNSEASAAQAPSLLPPPL